MRARAGGVSPWDGSSEARTSAGVSVTGRRPGELCGTICKDSVKEGRCSEAGSSPDLVRRSFRKRAIWGARFRSVFAFRGRNGRRRSRRSPKNRGDGRESGWTLPFSPSLSPSVSSLTVFHELLVQLSLKLFGSPPSRRLPRPCLPSPPPLVALSSLVRVPDAPPTDSPRDTTFFPLPFPPRARSTRSFHPPTRPQSFRHGSRALPSWPPALTNL